MVGAPPSSSALHDSVPEQHTLSGAQVMRPQARVHLAQGALRELECEVV